MRLCVCFLFLSKTKNNNNKNIKETKKEMQKREKNENLSINIITLMFPTKLNLKYTLNKNKTCSQRYAITLYLSNRKIIINFSFLFSIYLRN